MTDSYCTDNDQSGNAPFNDTDEPRKQQSIIGFSLAEGGMDTRAIDQYRQGVEVQTLRHRFVGMQPKIGSGDECHFTDVTTYGQPANFVKDQGDVKFVDKETFDTVGYMESPEAFFPIMLNGGPQDIFEGQMEPLTIPFRSNTTTELSSYTTRGFHGNIGDGNESVFAGKGNTRIEQAIDYESIGFSPFLEEGDIYFGSKLMANVADLTNDPFMLYQLSASFSGSGVISYFNDSIGNGPIMRGSSLEWQGGPFPTTVDNPNALDFTTPTNTFLRANVSGPNTSVAASITGSMTCEVVFFQPAVPTIARYLVDADYFTIGINNNTNNLIYQHNVISAQNFPFTTEMNTGGWNHIAFTRYDSTPGNQKISMYLNGTLMGTTADLAIQTYGSVGEFFIGTNDGSSLSDFEGLISYVKITKSALTQEQIIREADRLNRPLVNVDGAIKIDGYVSYPQTALQVFNDTTDEQLVERLQTTDSDMLSALKDLDYDLSEDIRGTFGKRSASAGSSVYGPNMASYGTDSIAFSNMLRGS
jgi:hypothetical protein